MENVDVLLLCRYIGATTRYRCFHLYEQLSLAGLCAQIMRQENMQFHCVRPGIKAIIICRLPFDSQLKRLFNIAKFHRIKVLYDIDDLVYDVRIYPFVDFGPRNSRFTTILERRLLEDEARRHLMSIQKADAVLVSTNFLAEEVRKMGKPAWVHRNAFSMEMLKLSEQALKGKSDRSASKKLVIGYASGTPTHDRDFQVVQPALKQILEEYPEAEVWIVGYLNREFGWGSVKRKVKHIPFVPWRELPFILAQFDINIAPLDISSRFCQAKSEVKYIEAGLVAVPTIASRNGAFEHAIRVGQTGFLAETSEDWYRYLKTLVTNSELRKEMGQQARQDVLRRYHPAVRAAELVRTLNEIGEAFQGRPFWPAKLEPSLTFNHRAFRYEELDHACQSPTSPKSKSLLAEAWAIFRTKGMRTFLLFALLFISKRITVFRKRFTQDRGYEN